MNKLCEKWVFFEIFVLWSNFHELFTHLFTHEFYFDNFLSPPLLSAENIPWEESNTEKWIVWHSSRVYNSIIKNSLKFLKWRKSEVMKDNMIFGWLLDKNWQFIETISYTFKQNSQHRIKKKWLKANNRVEYVVYFT